MIPRDVIESIRHDKYLIGATIPPAQRRGFEEIMDDLQKALTLLSQELYSKNAHFVLELIQNADDNSYGPDVTPAIEFAVTGSGLSVWNNETGFEERHVRALCSVGKSTKESALGYIGEKGIGFKSVFKVCAAPEIHSGGYHFGFKAGGGDLLGYVVPNWIDAQPERSSGTTIVLPLADSTGDIEALLADIQPELLLFLRRLRQLSIENCETRRIVRRIDDGASVTLLVEPGSHASDGEPYARYLVSKSHCDLSAVSEQKRAGVTSSEIVLAFPDVRSCEQPPAQSIFAFLPVRSYGFRFVIQGDFILSSNREDIQVDLPWNRAVRDAIPGAFAQAVAPLKSDDSLKWRILTFVPLSSEISGQFFAHVSAAIIERLKADQCVMSASGRWRTPAECVPAGDPFKTLLTNADLSRFVGREYVHESFADSRGLLETLGARPVSISDLCKCLAEPGWLAAHSDEWIGDLILALGKRKVSAQEAEQLKNLPWLPLAGGGYGAVAGAEVFFPFPKRDSPLEEELRVLRSSVVDGRKKEDRFAIEQFLRTLGVRDAGALEIIDKHILPIHFTGRWKSLKPKALVGHIAFVKANFDRYLDAKTKSVSNALVDQKRREAIQGLAVLRIRPEQGETDTDALIPSELYLPDEYGGEHSLKSLFLDIPGVRFVSTEYLEGGIEGSDDVERSEWRTFFSRIGVNRAPRVNKVTREVRADEPRPAEAMGRHVRVDDWLPAQETLALFRHSDPERVTSFLEVLDQEWSTTFAEKCVARMFWQYYTWHRVPADSTFLVELKRMPVRTRSGGVVALALTYHFSADLSVVFGEGLPYLALKLSSQKLMDAVGIASKADSALALRRLRELRTSESTVSAASVTHLYQLLALRFNDQAEQTQKVFASEPLVFVPGRQPRWLSSREVCWRESTALIDDRHPPLRRSYPGLETFFVQQLGVPERPGLPQLLALLSEWSNLDEKDARQIAPAVLRTYEEVEARLASEEERTRSEAADACRTIARDGLIWTNQDEFWKDDGDLFLNDRPDLAALFGGQPDIAFFGIPRELLPRLERFTNALGLAPVSKAALVSPLVEPNPVRSKDLEWLLRQRWIDLARFLFFKSHRYYEELVKRGFFQTACQLELAEIRDLTVEVVLRDHSVTARERCALFGSLLLVDATCASDPDQFAAGLGAALDLSSEAVDFLSLLLSRDSPESVERLFANRHIDPLPGDERQKLAEGEAEASVSGEPEREIAGPEEALPSGAGGATVDAPIAGREGASPEGERSRPLKEQEGQGTVEVSPVGDVHGQDIQPGASADGGATRRERSREHEAVIQVPIRRGIPVTGRNWWRVKVAGRDSPRSGKPDDRLDGDSRSDAASRAVVLEYERAHGREAEAAGVGQRGFDIRSWDPSESRERLIEVKGIQGIWVDDATVSMTGPQFDDARTDGAADRDRWLYVVDRTATPAPVVYPIREAAKKVARFYFQAQDWLNEVDEEAADSTGEAEPAPRVSVDARVDLIDLCDPSVHELIRRCDARCLPFAQFILERDGREYVAELAWPHDKVVVLAPAQESSGQLFADAGYQVFNASQFLDGDAWLQLSRVILPPGAEN